MNDYRSTTLGKKEIVAILSVAFYGSPWFRLDWNEDDYKSFKEEGDCYEDVLAKMLIDGKKVFVLDIEEECKYELSLKNLQKGVIMLDDFSPKKYYEYRTYKDDFYTMDAIVQLALFDDIIYG